MSQSPPLLVIVTGLPCTGKTVLAHRLAHDIHIPIIAKDDLKESLFDSLGWSDRDWSIKLGRPTIQLLYQLVENLLQAGIPVIAETYFRPEMAKAEFEAIQARTPFRSFVVECIADGEILYQRWQNRIQTGERHPGHVDHTALDQARTILLQGRNAPQLKVGNLYRIVDTTDFSGICYNELVKEIRNNI
ncbi:MAG TPA: ATP-binding protein [Bellilinea sp.]|nr:ATP-binding protein [Bellilinea sp.]